MNKRISKIANLIGIIVLAILLVLSVSITDQEFQTGEIANFIEKNSAPVENNVNDNLPWHLEKIEAAKAWRDTAGGNNIIVAVLDTGIDDTHEDLAGKVIGRVNFSENCGDADVNGHGTAVAGIIAASLENGKGTVGVAYDVSILSVKVADDAGIIAPEAAAKGIIWAAEKGARVINLSFTLNKPDQAVEDAINFAWDKGAVLVAAAGNIPSTKETCLAAYPNVISVGAVDKDDSVCRWSGKGNWVSVNAPGVEIFTTDLNGKYTTKSGTSFAAALVSGEAALLFTIARDTNANGRINDEVRTAILKNTTDTGRINVLRAVDSLK